MCKERDLENLSFNTIYLGIKMLQHEHVCNVLILHRVFPIR